MGLTARESVSCERASVCAHVQIHICVSTNALQDVSTPLLRLLGVCVFVQLGAFPPALGESQCIWAFGPPC